MYDDTLTDEEREWGDPFGNVLLMSKYAPPPRAKVEPKAKPEKAAKEKAEKEPIAKPSWAKRARRRRCWCHKAINNTVFTHKGKFYCCKTCMILAMMVAHTQRRERT